MPAYNFQKQFVPMILDGSKGQTIRRKRKRPTVAGDTLYLYVGMRTKNCELIGKTTCVKVTPIILFPPYYIFSIDGIAYGFMHAKTKMFAFNDGFTSTRDFFDFFLRYEKAVLDDFEIIEWDPEQLEVENAA